MKVIWERIESKWQKGTKRSFVEEVGPGSVYRAKVPGGWFVVWGYGPMGGPFFYPDPEYKWDGNSLP